MKILGFLMGLMCLVSCGKEIDATKITTRQRQPKLPVLIGKEQNPILEFQLNVLDSATTYAIKTVTFDFEETLQFQIYR